ncbi:MAG TPA: carboxymuconolactone decarboxylase family protein [Tepidisphaeraceae bacterium]|jgi:AhpD family alkylhydroperoxidase|nr:carboxymuconolactone decarboxylase family protein [Tepidisphaeraceae bacterium]
MQPRINFPQIAPKAYQAMSGVEAYINGSGLDHGLIHLVKLRASQMNGCAFCIDMHWKDARANGEAEQRLYGLDAWAEAPYYTDRERAALEWTEVLTRVGDTHAPDAAYEAMRAHFNEKEAVDLTWVIAAINAWNRMAIGLRSPAGSYQPAKK